MPAAVLVCGSHGADPCLSNGITIVVAMVLTLCRARCTKSCSCCTCHVVGRFGGGCPMLVVARVHNPPGPRGVMYSC